MRRRDGVVLHVRARYARKMQPYQRSSMSDSAGRWGVVCNLVASRYGRIIAAVVFSLSTAAFAAGQPPGLSGPIPAQIEGNPLFHKHFLQSGAIMAAAG